MGMTVDLLSYKPLYIQTAREYVGTLISGLHALEKKPDDSEAINSMYIAAHSLASQSFIMSYLGVATLCKHMEGLFKTLKEGSRAALTTEQITILLQVSSAMERAINDLESSGTMSELPDEQAAVKSMIIQ